MWYTWIMNEGAGKGGETDMLRILRKWAHKGAHRRKAGQPTQMWVKPREAGQTWTL